MKYVHSQILEGNVVLFLGAGASYNCRNLEGERIGFSGSDLQKLIGDKFLDGKYEGYQLDFLATLAVRKVGRNVFDSYLRDIIKDFEPTEEHILLTKYKWKRIYTTNYDEVIENVYYEERKNNNYKLEKITSDSDPISNIITDSNNVPLIKLHGCISRISDKNLPLVISRASYRHVLENRSALFQLLKEDLSNSLIVFYGYGLEDLNIIGLLDDLEREGIEKPRHIWLDPYMDDMKQDFWSSNNLDCQKKNLTEFLKEIPDKDKILKSLSRNDSIISHLIPSHNRPSAELESYIKEQLIYITKSNNHDSYNQDLFYRGSSNGFDWVFNNLDFERTVLSEIVKLIYIESDIASNKFNFFLVNGYAGSGKTVLLKRLAWIGINKFNKPCFYLNEGGQLDIDIVIELIDLINEPIYLFLENILSVQYDIEKIRNYCKKNDCEIYIIGEARTNEWNNDANQLDPMVDEYFDLRDLDNKEIKLLIEKLDSIHIGGTYKLMSNKEKFDFIKKNNNKQLLVTLLEVTNDGKEFSEIIKNEFESIYDRIAKELYLNICTLHQYGVQVRAGMVNRLSGIGFTKFKDEFLEPLELLIVSFYSHKVNDYVYITRHQNIAEQVYLQAFMSEAEKAQHLIKIVRYLNVAYKNDRYALEKILRGKNLSSQFNDKHLVYQLYKIAFDVGINSSFILHQKAIFEMTHNIANLNLALSHLNEIDMDDTYYEMKIVNHTRANLYRKLALLDDDLEKKNKYWGLGLKLLNSNLRGVNYNSRNHDTKGRILLDEIKYLSSIGELVVDVVNEFEANINDGFKKFPYDESLTTLEYDFSRLLDDMPITISKLEYALSKNSDSMFILQRYAKYYIEKGEFQIARNALEKYLKNHPNDKEINYLMAFSFIKEDKKENIKTITNYLKRSYSPNDSFYMKKFEHAKLEYLFGNQKTAKKLFDELASSNLPPKVKNQIRLNGNKLYDAIVVTISEKFGFISCNEFEENIYMSKDSAAEEDWSLLSRRDRVQITLSFTFRGPRVYSLSLR